MLYANARYIDAVVVSQDAIASVATSIRNLDTRLTGKVGALVAADVTLEAATTALSEKSQKTTASIKTLAVSDSVA